jgi:hypothetical protein
VEEDWLHIEEEEKIKLLKVTEILIKAGADLSAKNNSEETPMENFAVQELKKLKPELF